MPVLPVEQEVEEMFDRKVAKSIKDTRARTLGNHNKDKL
jgi:hypothetical protein